jgi:hypothetical protein
MNLQARCKNCRSFIAFQATVKDRFELARKRGEKIDLKCRSCGTKDTYDVNDIKAVESKFIAIVALLLFLCGTTALFIYLWPYFFATSYIYAISGMIGILTIPFLVFQAINHGQLNRVQYFNTKRHG